MDHDKRCSRCREYRPLGEFNRDRRSKDGLDWYCRPCRKAYRAGAVGAWHRAPNSVRDAHGKTCPRCQQHKQWSDYQKCAGVKDGHQSYCRQCAYAYECQSDERNAEAIKARWAEKLARQADPGLTKRCCGCKQVKPHLEFYAHRATGDGRTSYCRDCAREYGKKHRAKYPVKVRESNARRETDTAKRQHARKLTRKWRLQLYGLTPDSYDALLDSQDSVCAICGSPGQLWAERNLHVDHDHETNEVRGLLCRRCNLGIGYFVDDVGLLAQAIDYLKHPPARRFTAEAATA